MKSLSTQFFVLILGLCISTVVFFVLQSKIVTEYNLLRLVPRYPNATKWKIEVNPGIPNGGAGTSIWFFSNDVPKNVYDFYSEKLIQKGWAEESMTNSLVLRKSFNGRTYFVHIINNSSFDYRSTDQRNWTVSISYE